MTPQRDVNWTEYTTIAESRAAGVLDEPYSVKPTQQE